MRNKFFVLILSVFLIVLSCNSIGKKEAKHRLENLINMHVSDSIEITDYKEHSDFRGYHTEEFEVHFKNEEEFIDIFKKVKPPEFETVKGVYGFTVERNEELTSAIFKYSKCIIRYTYRSP